MMPSSCVRTSGCSGCVQRGHPSLPADLSRQQEELEVPANIRKDTQVISETVCSVDIQC